VDIAWLDYLSFNAMWPTGKGRVVPASLVLPWLSFHATDAILRI